MLIFSPLVWNKYHLFLFPFWGWLAWEARQTNWRAALVIFAIAMEWGSWPNLPEPLNSHMLWGIVTIVVMAVARICTRAPPAMGEFL
jgi:hypothetical protein